MENKNLEEKEINTEEEKIETTEVAEVVEDKNEEVVEEVYNGPSVTTNTRYDYRTMKYFNMYNMVHKRHFPIIYFAFGLVAFAFAVYMVIANVIIPLQKGTIEEFTITLIFLPAVMFLFGLYFIYESLFFERVIDKNITNHFIRDPRVIGIDVTVTEEEVIMNVKVPNSNPVKYNWAYVTEIIEIPQFYFLYVQKQPIIIEKDSNKVIDGDYSELVRIIQEKTKTKPYKKCDKEVVKKPITFVHQEEENNYQEAETVNEEENQDSEIKNEDVNDNKDNE